MTNIIDLNWSFLEILFLFIVFIVGFSITYFILPYLINFMKRKGFVGNDIHKNKKPEIAESGGISILIGLLFSSILLIPSLNLLQRTGSHKFRRSSSRFPPNRQSSPFPLRVPRFFRQFFFSRHILGKVQKMLPRYPTNPCRPE